MADGVSSVDTISTYVHLNIQSQCFVILIVNIGPIIVLWMY